MIESIEFTNFKALRKTTLPLAPFTLLLGPNGSGKTFVLQALKAVASLAAQQVGIHRHAGARIAMDQPQVLSVTQEDRNAQVGIIVHLRLKDTALVVELRL